MKVLVTGAYGLIGQAVCARLLASGHEVIGIGRDIARARRRAPRIDWRHADIARLTEPGDWTDFLDGVQAVVNAAGLLQSGLRDDVSAVQTRAVTALIGAAEAAGIERFVQISAPGAVRGASTPFMSSKAMADQALAASGLDWVILRPALVIAPNAYGGTALIRALAAFPWVTPLVLAEAPVRTVSIDAVAETAAQALSGEIAPGTDQVLAEAQPGRWVRWSGAFGRGWAWPRRLCSPCLASSAPPLPGRPTRWAGWVGVRPCAPPL